MKARPEPGDGLFVDNMHFDAPVYRSVASYTHAHTHCALLDVTFNEAFGTLGTS
jgi:hypothetical protein